MEKDVIAWHDSFLQKFYQIQPALSALGDHTRQCIMITLIKHSGEGGLRVGDLQKEAGVSRTALSHHLKILLDAHIINVRKQGTKNFYYLDAKSDSLQLMIQFWQEVEPMMKLCRQFSMHDDRKREGK